MDKYFEDDRREARVGRNIASGFNRKNGCADHWRPSNIAILMKHRIGQRFSRGRAGRQRGVMGHHAPALCRFQIHIGGNHVHFRQRSLRAADFLNHAMDGGAHGVSRMQLTRLNV